MTRRHGVSFNLTDGLLSAKDGAATDANCGEISPIDRHDATGGTMKTRVWIAQDRDHCQLAQNVNGFLASCESQGHAIGDIHYSTSTIPMTQGNAQGGLDGVVYVPLFSVCVVYGPNDV